MKSLRIVSVLLLGAAISGGVASAQQYITSTIAGTIGSSGYSGDGGAATVAQMANPLCVAVDSRGNYYFVDHGNYVIREVIAATGVINTIAGIAASPGYSGDGGLATAAQISTVEGLAVDSSGNVYFSDTGNARVRKIDTNGIITTYAGIGTRGDSGDFGPAASAQISMPSGLAVDAAGNLFIADYGNGTVRKVSTAGVITTAAGVDFIGFAIFPGDEGPAGQATLGLPYSVAVDESGILYIADLGSSSIRKVSLDGRIHTLVPQVATASLAADMAGNLYYADYHASTIIKVYPTGLQATIAGNYYSGYLTDGAPGLYSEFNHPYSVALDSSANLYIADYGNNAIRQMALVPPSTVVAASGASNVGYSAGSGGISNVPVAIAPGEMVTLFGLAIGPSTQVQAQPDANGLIETQLAGTTVTFNGIPAPVFSTGYLQVVAIAPYELSGMSQAAISLSYQGSVVGTTTVPLAITAPQIFTPLSAGFTGGTVQNADGTTNSAANPAAESSSITIFVTGEGQTAPHGVDGLVAQGPTFPIPVQPVTVTIGGLTASLSTYGGVLGQVAGIMQIVATIPTGVTTSKAVPVTVQVGNSTSLTAYIAVQ